MKSDMDRTTESSSVLLKHVADANEALIALHFALRSKTGICDARHGFDLRRCGDGCLIDIFVEAESKDAQVYCWWLEIQYERKAWKIESAILKNQGGRQDAIKRFPDRAGTLLQDFLSQIQASTRELVTSAEGFAFA